MALACASADFLGVALEAAEERGTSSAACGAALLTSQPPVVTLRLSEVAVSATEDVGRADARAVRCVAVDVLGGRVATLPNDAPALSRLLTNGACAREWASRLWRAGVTKLQARVIEPTEGCVHSWCYLLADEESNDDTASRSWTLPLVQEAERTPLSAELLGNSGFQLVLELRAGITDTLLASAALEPVLYQLVHSSFLLAPSADLLFEVERASPPDASLLTQSTVSASYRNVSGLSVDARSRFGTGCKLERLKHASAAHLAASAALTRDQDGAEHLAGPLPDEGNTCQAAGHAQLTTGAPDKRVTWTMTAVVASTMNMSREDCTAAPVVGVHGCADAKVFCFANSVLLLHPPVAVLDVLRAKVTAAEWKTAFGLHLTGCTLVSEPSGVDKDPRAPQFPSCASLRFAKCDTPTVFPGLITLHRSCLPLSLGSAKLPKLGRKREAALVKAALSAALREFKTVSGGGSRSERVLRKHGLPAIAAAVAKVATAGDYELRACGAALTERRPGAAGPDGPPAAGVDQDPSLEKAVLASLLDVLAGDFMAVQPPPEAEPEAEVPVVLCSTADQDHDSERSRHTSQLDDDDVFPQRRRSDSSPPLQSAALEDASVAAALDDDDAGWFL